MQVPYMGSFLMPVLYPAVWPIHEDWAIRDDSGALGAKLFYDGQEDLLVVWHDLNDVKSCIKQKGNISRLAPFGFGDKDHKGPVSQFGSQLDAQVIVLVSGQCRRG